MIIAHVSSVIPIVHWLNLVDNIASVCFAFIFNNLLPTKIKHTLLKVSKSFLVCEF